MGLRIWFCFALRRRFNGDESFLDLHDTQASSGGDGGDGDIDTGNSGMGTGSKL